MANTSRIEIRCFRYRCPDCGTGDEELGHLATSDEVHCFVCLVDEDRYVRLRRWHAEEDVLSEPGESTKT